MESKKKRVVIELDAELEKEVTRFRENFEASISQREALVVLIKRGLKAGK